LFYPETSNISLEDIDKIFMKDDDDSSERSSTIADSESAEMRMGNEQDTEKAGQREVEHV
jgi:hypothetical protein